MIPYDPLFFPIPVFISLLSSIIFIIIPTWCLRDPHFNSTGRSRSSQTSPYTLPPCRLPFGFLSISSTSSSSSSLLPRFFNLHRRYCQIPCFTTFTQRAKSLLSCSLSTLVNQPTSFPSIHSLPWPVQFPTTLIRAIIFPSRPLITQLKDWWVHCRRATRDFPEFTHGVEQWFICTMRPDWWCIQAIWKSLCSSSDCSGTNMIVNELGLSLETPSTKWPDILPFPLPTFSIQFSDDHFSLSFCPNYAPAANLFLFFQSTPLTLLEFS